MNADITKLPKAVAKMIRDFVLENQGIWSVPECGLNGIDVSWLMNMNKKPNIKCGQHEDERKYTEQLAVTAIRPGQELFLSAPLSFYKNILALAFIANINDERIDFNGGLVNHVVTNYGNTKSTQVLGQDRDAIRLFRAFPPPKTVISVSINATAERFSQNSGNHFQGNFNNGARFLKSLENHCLQMDVTALHHAILDYLYIVGSYTYVQKFHGKWLLLHIFVELAKRKPSKVHLYLADDFTMLLPFTFDVRDALVAERSVLEKVFVIRELTIKECETNPTLNPLVYHDSERKNLLDVLGHPYGTVGRDVRFWHMSKKKVRNLIRVCMSHYVVALQEYCRRDAEEEQAEAESAQPPLKRRRPARSPAIGTAVKRFLSQIDSASTLLAVGFYENWPKDTYLQMPSEKNLAEIKEMITAVLRQQNVSMASIRGSIVFKSSKIEARDAKAHTEVIQHVADMLRIYQKGGHSQGQLTALNLGEWGRASIRSLDNLRRALRNTAVGHLYWQEPANKKSQFGAVKEATKQVLRHNRNRRRYMKVLLDPTNHTFKYREHHCLCWWNFQVRACPNQYDFLLSSFASRENLLISQT